MVFLIIVPALVLSSYFGQKFKTDLNLSDDPVYLFEFIFGFNATFAFQVLLGM